MTAAVALLSGGLDSLVAATHAVRHGGLAVALTFDYGQRAAEREKTAARAVAAELGAEHRVVSLPFLGACSLSALNDPSKALPLPSEEELDDFEAGAVRAQAVWVPNRNGVFIHLAAAWAQGLGLDRVVVGFNREEGRTFPDNRPEYLEAVNRSLAFSLGTPVRVESPTMDLDKAGIVRLGLELGAPLRHVWSCYGPGPPENPEKEECAKAYDSGHYLIFRKRGSKGPQCDKTSSHEYDSNIPGNNNAPFQGAERLEYDQIGNSPGQHGYEN